MITVDSDKIKQYADDLKRFTKFAYPIATQATVNTAAFETMKTARAGLDDKMVLRNTFTKRSILFERSPKTLTVNRQRSRVGSTADYMEDQELGAVKRKKGRVGVPIPTSYGSGLSDNARPRTRLPRKANKLQNIRLSGSRRISSNRRQGVLLAVRDAVKTGRRFIFMDLGRKKGIFRVVGGRRGTKSGWPGKAKLKMLYDLSEQSVDIPRNPWLKPATDVNAKKLPLYYQRALEFQIKRNKLFRE